MGVPQGSWVGSIPYLPDNPRVFTLLYHESVDGRRAGLGEATATDENGSGDGAHTSSPQFTEYGVHGGHGEVRSSTT